MHRSKNMLKNIELKLVQIRYSGDSIGDDIRVEVEVLGKFLRVDKRVKVKTTVQVNQLVGIFETDQKIFKFNTQIVVIEKDLLFNDISNGSVSIKVNTEETSQQKFTCEIKIRETRAIFGKIWGNKTAVFEIILEAKVSDAFLYVLLEKTKNGWLQARKQTNDEKIDLPAYLKLKLERQDNKFQYFTIWEGINRGIKAYMKFQKDGTSYFEKTNYQIGPIHLIYSLSQKTLKFENKIYKLKEYKDDPQPWKKTLYDIKIPDFYHKGGLYYIDKVNLAPVWFKTTHSDGVRYVHPGSYSLGCVTLTEIERWDELCKVLLRARRDDFENIGILEVID
ncbi:MAG: hypothetical protein A2444_04260 [Candidatus Staskawiczbacteria bacterium RIFOXYC2_FULL_37_19]|nr:MAG: hypothetical protein A2444_04260 [Candidatus Staskawiczbacteria bacterium RIFOXYC2_FULL_37_19]